MFFALFYRAYDFDDPTYIDLASNASQPVFNTKGKYPGRRMAIACKILKFPKLTGGEQDLNPPNNYGLGEVLHTVLVGFPQNENYGGQFVTQGDAVTRGGYNSNLDAFASVAVGGLNGMGYIPASDGRDAALLVPYQVLDEGYMSQTNVGNNHTGLMSINLGGRNAFIGDTWYSNPDGSPIAPKCENTWFAPFEESLHAMNATSYPVGIVLNAHNALLLLL